MNRGLHASATTTAHTAAATTTHTATTHSATTHNNLLNKCDLDFDSLIFEPFKYQYSPLFSSRDPESATFQKIVGHVAEGEIYPTPQYLNFH